MIKLGLLFTHGISLDDWKKAGFLLREVEYYQYLYRNNIKTTFYTYGDIRDLSINKQIKNINTVIPHKVNFTQISTFNLINNILSVFYIVMHSREEDLLKTNQLKAAFPAIILKYFFLNHICFVLVMNL